MAQRPSSPLMGVFLGLLDRTRVRSRLARITASAAVVLALGLGWSVVYATNGASTPFTHVMHVPIILASITFGVSGGVLAAIAAAILLGPFMPYDVARSLEQSALAPLYRGGFFLLIGVVIGTFADAARLTTFNLRRAQERWERQSIENVRLIARLVAGRDEQTGRHCERVGRNAVELARAAGVHGETLQHIYLAGVLHDLGKLKVPGAILRKRTALTYEETGVMMEHPAHGEEIVLSIFPAAVDIARGTRSHHERWDGGGYPDGLVGEEIPLIGRILSIVDVFEAVTGTRPYRGPMAVAEARRLIAEGAGRHFDPALVELFLALEREGRIEREIERPDEPVAVEGYGMESTPAA